MKRTQLLNRLLVFFLCLQLIFAGCQQKSQGPHHFIKLRAEGNPSRGAFDTAVMVLDQRLKNTYDGDVTVRAEGETIILEVAGRPNLDSLAVLVLSKGGFGMYEMYTNDQVALTVPGAEIAPGSIEVVYAVASDTADVRKRFIAGNRSLYNVLFSWGPDGALRKNYYPLYALKRSAGGRPLISKDMIGTARPNHDQLGHPSVSIILKDDYVDTWLRATRDNVGRHIAIRFANQVLSAPQVLTEIPGGNMEVSGGFSWLRAKMLAAMIATPDLEVPLQIVHIDTALFVPLRGYPTLRQQARYEVIQGEFLRLRPKLDSLLMGSDAQFATARREMERIYDQDINTIVAETHATQVEVDEFIIKMETVLRGLKDRLIGPQEPADPDSLKKKLEISLAQ